MEWEKKNFPVKKKSSKTYFCFAYPNDLNEAYAFYCARYRDISFKEFLNIGITEFSRKFSIPESEPLYKIIKSRTINLSTIKDKGEKKYWQELKRVNAIPKEYLSDEEIMIELKNFTKEKKIW